MEKKKLDLNSIIGFVLIFGIMIWIMYQNKPTQAEIDKKAKQELVEKSKIQEPKVAEVVAPVTITDSVQTAKMKATLGSFAYSATLPSAKSEFTTIQNELLILKIANKGGYIAEATLKNFKQISKDSGKLVQLIKDNNAGLNITLQTQDSRTLNTKDLFFEPTLTKVGGDQMLSMKLKAGPNQFLEYKYVLKANDYMLDFDVRSQGLASVLNTTKPADLEWNLKSYRSEKSISNENRFTDIRYEYEDGKHNNVGQGKDSEETLDKVTYVAYKQHFFSSILLTNTPFEKAKLYSSNIVDEEKGDTIYT
ncbi:YidC/Oxa1 family insertase periplasmic-domain containing protein, partial [Flavobacterium sp.]|uniref:YidC/Oxa1 family insertase periplasmic-domain containing protein n=1 Tax=Flavobacterium sp. TaxID=239 RepID=UPI003751FE65